MSEVTTFADIHRILEDWPAGVKRHRHTLDHMYELLAYLGDPQERFKIIHVAGTSGKSSTAYYAAALLQAAGKRVGLTVSPHVDEINERVQIDLVPLPEKRFVPRFKEFLQLVEASKTKPGYFELFTAFAFWEFAAQRVEYAVVEVGIGGLLDSTNVFNRRDKVCVITDIGFDHMNILGHTLTEIAEQKAGIIQLHNPVFCYQQGKAVTEAIQRSAAQKQADLHMLLQVEADQDRPFLPLFQQRNFGLARAAIEFVLARDGVTPLTPGKVQAAAHTYIPARMELMKIEGKTLIVDVAHNAQKLHTLLQSVHAAFPKQAVAVMVRLATKDWRIERMKQSMAELMAGADHLIITSLSEHDVSEEVLSKLEQLAAVCRQAHYRSFEIVPDPKEAYQKLCARSEPIVLVTGSFLLLNHIRPLLKNNKK